MIHPKLRNLQGRFEFEGAVLQKAGQATFKRRGTSLPTELPQALAEAFFASPEAFSA